MINKENFFLVSNTAFPGFHKLLILLVVTILFTPSQVSTFVNDTFIVFILGFLTVFNWSSFTLIDLLKFPEEKRPQFFEKIVTSSLVFQLLLIPIVIFLHSMSIVSDLAGTCVFLCCWSIHQLWRYYYLAILKYDFLFISDLVFTITTILAVLVCYYLQLNLMICLSVGTIITPLLFSIRKTEPSIFVLRNFKVKAKRQVITRSLNYSIINLSTGGIQLLFAPLSYQLLDPQSTTIVGLASNIAAVSLLLPRSMSFKFNPLLVKHFNDYSILNDTFKRFRKQLNKLIFVLLVVSLTIGGCILLFDQFMSSRTILLFGIILINQLASQFALPASNLLMVIKYHTYLRNTNLLTFILFFSLLPLLFLTINDGFYIVLIAIVLQTTLTLLRSIFLNKKVSHIMNI